MKYIKSFFHWPDLDKADLQVQVLLSPPVRRLTEHIEKSVISNVGRWPQWSDANSIADFFKVELNHADLGLMSEILAHNQQAEADESVANELAIKEIKEINRRFFENKPA